ncbi:MAG: S-formylglutathione hydrolase [cyanobacterium endosymbiont of Rhopalodia musculus]|uniref:S-formylglutathione hydrolase n=1 Tax=cyanobacterium endosymbiont of Epithemia clementina EcSB TaxID=3034674 RepID=UPI00248045B9|nr:S-formylglutathione hydrolase [cyanobacterium endosymbiont of Epithemia clementina EcSB]WGT67569.1 S-formylglutathione hydrolase [cyanobacterium endosymbiont of Epithemia clementina EcSB]
MRHSLTLKSKYQCFGGTVAYYSHQSQCCNHQMNFAVYLPPKAKIEPIPVLYYLSGLTCTEENFIVKAGAHQFAAKYGIMLVVPDTSPRDTKIAEEDKTWDLGSGAGFYVDAIIEPWKSHYQMYSYVVKELHSLIQNNFNVNGDKTSIFGHSMGGHGALVCALRNPQQYTSVSAFAPITSPIHCSWGEKAFTAYLGNDKSNWYQYDASELVKQTQLQYPLLIDQGLADPFYRQKQLLPEKFKEACEYAGQSLILRYQKEYDHSYFMISSFIEDHISYHAMYLNS